MKGREGGYRDQDYYVAETEISAATVEENDRGAREHN